ncbi:hypothetical protein Tco_0874629 [Tanacetum coccineum]|uniref:Uncharacterized protein n=1 Tax=Tanacetum coccineum TaxID=301880 RepID=A0ABQ5BMX5_9ASTR
MLTPNKVKKKVAADNRREKNVNEGKKVVEKLVSSKKAKKVAVESELVPEDNDALVSADEEEVETKVKQVVDVSADEEEAEIVERNKKKINDAPNKVIKKVAGGNKRKKDVNEGNKVDGKLVSFKKLKQVADGSELVLVDNEKEGCKRIRNVGCDKC